MKTYTDQTNRTISIPLRPKRIVSLVPSQTELLHYLGLEEQTIGITKFCIHPEHWFRQKTRIGGTKTVNLEKVRALKPDLIIANKEENDKDQILKLVAEFPVWLSDITDLEDAYGMISSISKMTNTEERGEELILKLKQQFSELSEVEQPINAAYFIWQNPYMAAGSGTFINSILKIGGYRNIFTDFERYPVIDPELLRKRSPELIFLSSEPFPFKEKHIARFQEICPSATILMVDGELFSWYGSRLLHTVDYLQKLHVRILKAKTIV